jgi:hypothetical protein
LQLEDRLGRPGLMAAGDLVSTLRQVLSDDRVLTSPEQLQPYCVSTAIKISPLAAICVPQGRTW